MTNLTQTGGARLGNFNASYPFATISGDADALHITCLGRDCHFPRSSILRLSRHEGLFSVGLRIEHTLESMPPLIVFWASPVFWTSGFRKLKGALGDLGYTVFD